MSNESASSPTQNSPTKGDPAWSDFWARNARANQGGAAEGGGCLPARWHAIEKAQASAWAGFVEGLDDRSALLDLATGDARVLRWIQQMKPDFTLTGTDLAPQLPPSPQGITVHAGTAMEALPFDADSFDAVTSQFGFEYGDVSATSAEIARILRSGGQVGIMVHRGDGPILAHNMERKAQIEWVLSKVKLLSKTKAKLTAGMQAKGGPFKAVSAATKAATKVAAEGERKFGQGSAAWEIPEAVRRTLMMGAKAGAQSIVGTLDAIAEQAGNEVGRINSLAGACKTADARDSLNGAMQEAGFTVGDVTEVTEPEGRAFADFLTFTLA
jgi:SAM-dependent methyltransferase